MRCFLRCCFPDEDAKEEGGLNIALDEGSGVKRTWMLADWTIIRDGNRTEGNNNLVYNESNIFLLIGFGERNLKA